MADDQKKDSQREETAEEKRRHYLTDEERREWSGLAEWRDPLEKEKPEPDPNDGKFALASLLCGIGAVLLACIHISSLLLGAAAIICGIISKKKSETARTLSTVGIVLGCICFGIAGILEVFHIMGKLFPADVNPDTIINMPSDLASELADE